MTDKTLKIRIKLHTTQDSPVNQPPIPDKISKETLSTEQHGGQHKHLTKVFVFAGVLTLTATVFYFGLSNRDTTDKRASIDVQSATLSDSHHPKKQLAANASESAFPLNGPSVKDLSSLDEPTTPLPKEEEITAESIPSSLQRYGKQSSDSVVLAKENPPLSESPDQQIIANETVLKRAHELVTAPTSAPQTAIDSLEDMPSRESSNTAELAERPEVSNSESSVDSSYLLDSPSIVRAQLTSGVVNREPIDRIEEVVYVDGQPLKRLFYYTEFRNMQGQKAVHRWEHKGKVVAEVKINIRGDRWRAYSSKYLSPSMTGEWKILVIDAKGTPLKSEHFVYSSY